MPNSHEFVRDIQYFAQSIVDTVREPLLILDTALRVQSANRAFYRTFQVDVEETMGRCVYNLGDGQWDIPALRTLLEEIIPATATFDDFQVDHTFPRIGREIMILNARRVYSPGNTTELLILVMEDVTERRAVKEKLQAEYEREHQIALALQRPLLLGIAEDAFKDLSVATLYSAAQESQGEAVGGDFFDGFALADGRVALVLGDATGKGLTAAARGTEVKDVVRAFLRVYPYHAAQTLTRLNDYLCDTQSLDHRSQGELMALMLAVIDTSKSEITLAWAGIEPPLLMRGNGEVDVVTGGGMMLGVVPHEVYDEATVSFHKGDTLVMTTDGLSEARRGKELLGQEGVIALVKVARNEASLYGMSHVMLSGARAFAGGQLQDDACLLLARMR